MKCEHRVKIRNDLGLHTRPATVIVRILQKYQVTVYFQYRNALADAKSIMSILTLAVKKNATITIIAEGKDAKIAVKSLVEAFDNKFGENK